MSSRDDKDLVGGRRARDVICMSDGTSVADIDTEYTWIQTLDRQKCTHSAPLYGSDHWADNCPCRPVVQEDGVILHRVDN